MWEGKGVGRECVCTSVCVVHCTVLYCTLLNCTLLYSTLLYSTLLYSTLLYSTLLKCDCDYDSNHNDINNNMVDCCALH